MSSGGFRSNLLPILGLALLSLAVALGWTLDLHNADSLIPVLVSLDLWLPFYWGQDRFGMLVALLVAPIRDSFWNLIVQNALGVFLLIAGAYAAANRCGVRCPQLVAFALLSVLLAWPAETTALQLLTTNQSYGPALGLFAVSFAMLRPHAAWTTQSAAVLVMVLGAWTNAGTGLLMFVLFGAAAATPRLRASALPLFVSAAFALAIHFVLQRIAPGVRLDQSHVALVGLETFGTTAAAFWSDAYQQFLGPAIWLTVPFSVIALFLERQNLVARSAVLAVFGACLAYGALMIVFFGGVGRHVTPALPLLLGALFIVLARHVSLSRNQQRVLTAGMAVAVVLQSGVEWPEVGRRRLVTRLADGHALELYEERVTVVTGDYWRAWPYAFAINMLHERVSGERPVLTVALRSENLHEQHRRAIGPGTRLAVVPSHDSRYWSLRGPNVELSVLRTAPDYEVAIVTATRLSAHPRGPASKPGAPTGSSPVPPPRRAEPRPPRE